MLISGQEQSTYSYISASAIAQVLDDIVHSPNQEARISTDMPQPYCNVASSI